MYPTRKERITLLKKNRQELTVKKRTAFLSTTLLLSTLALPSFSVRASADETASTSHSVVKELSEDSLTNSTYIETDITEEENEEAIEIEQPEMELPPVEELPEEEPVDPEVTIPVPPTTDSKPAPTPPVHNQESPVQATLATPPVTSKSLNKDSQKSSSELNLTEIEETKEMIRFSKTQTTEAFIASISDSAMEVGEEHDLYPSVMIAQAVLESGSGSSTLSQEPNYNLFGVKGNYEGATVKLSTQEDNGKGSLFTIKSQFRKYPSYKESFLDYAKVLKEGPGFNGKYYIGTWRSNTDSYKDATEWLTGRYATDTRYAEKLNALIECYDLTQYDTPKEEEKTIYHTVVPNDTLWDIATQYNVTIDELKSWNQLDSNLIYTGNKLIVGFEKNATEKAEKNVEQVALKKSAETLKHIVKGTESLQVLALRYHVTPGAIKKWNAMSENILFVGQQLRIPKF